jgi:hypothetical protein
MSDRHFETWPPSPEEPGGSEPGGFEPGVDEEALRRMLRGAVDTLEPSDGTLEFLQRAVPARRTRRKQLVVGAVAAALLVGSAVPALVRVAGSPGTEDPRASVATSHSAEGSQQSAGSGGAAENGGPTQGAEKGGGGAATEKSDEGADEGTTSPNVGMANTPACTADQLGTPAATASQPNGDGVVLGSFKITNASGSNCKIDDTGQMHADAVGDARSSQINVAQHSEGDGANGLLPAPSAAPAAFMLPAGTSYEVKFAWVPQQSGGPSGCSDDSTASPQPTEEVPQTQGEPLAETSGGTGDGGGSEGGSGGGTGDAAVQLSHTPDGDSQTATITVQNACAGTVYYMEAMPTG